MQQNRRQTVKIYEKHKKEGFSFVILFSIHKFTLFNVYAKICDFISAKFNNKNVDAINF